MYIPLRFSKNQRFRSILHLVTTRPSDDDDILPHCWLRIRRFCRALAPMSRQVQVMPKFLLVVLCLTAAPLLAQGQKPEDKPPLPLPPLTPELPETPEPPANPLDMSQDTYVLGATLVTLYHELGHALVEDSGVPVLGREEDAVDAFALVELITQLRDTATDAQTDARLVQYGYASIDQWGKQADEEGEPDLGDYYGVHALHRQRMFNTACLLMGAEPDLFEQVPALFGIDEFYFFDCERSYFQAYDGWTYLLDTFGAFEQDRENAEDDITYVINSADREQHRRWEVLVREWAELAEVNRHFSTSFHMKRPIEVRFESCGEENAYYYPDDNSISMCYELMASYARQYRQ